MHWLQPIKASEEFAVALPARGERSESRPLFPQPRPPGPTQGQGWNLQSWLRAAAGASLSAVPARVPHCTGAIGKRVSPCLTPARVSSVG